ncbi:MAG: MlaD family protein, partial [Alistipes sp.]|nr:MlaD family protein [Alistipes sp.]
AIYRIARNMKLRSEVKVGIFALVALVCLYWGINFLKRQDLFKRNSVYYASYDEVSGLQKSGSVMVKGFKIGLISDIRYDPQRSDKIIVEMSIRSKYKIP